jgi:pyruvate/2-oxoglutarate dehydrogenase complex dihydrolipoamide acyltransferase (E2) component
VRCPTSFPAEFVAAAAEYFLQRADLFGDRWKQAETLLLDCITDHNVEPDKRRLRAVPEDMVGVSWPAVPVPVPPRSKAMNRSWAQAQADRAAVAAAQQTAAGAQRGAAAAGSSGGVAAAAAGEDLVLVGVVPGQAAAAAGKRGAGSSQEEQQPAAAAAADAMGGPVAAPYGHGIGWHDKEVKKAPDYSGQLSRMITMVSEKWVRGCWEERGARSASLASRSPCATLTVLT